MEKYVVEIYEAHKPHNFWRMFTETNLMSIPTHRYEGFDLFNLRFSCVDEEVNVPSNSIFKVKGKEYKCGYKTVNTGEADHQPFKGIHMMMDAREIDTSSLPNIVWKQLGSKKDNELYLVKLRKYNPNSQIFVNMDTYDYYCYKMEEFYVLRKK